MSTWLKRYFVVTGALSVVCVLFPHAILLGLFLFIVPGLILLSGPPLFLYGLVAVGTWGLTASLGPRARQGVTLLVLAAVAVGVPVYFNWPFGVQSDELTAGDRPLAAPLNLKKTATVALLRPQFSRAGRDPLLETDCDDLCQRLLFNGAVGAVLLGATPAGLDDPLPTDGLARYRVERRETCPPVKVPDGAFWPDEYGLQGRVVPVSKKVVGRIAGGECLIRDEGALHEADAVVVERTLRKRLETKNRWLDAVEAKRLSLLLRSPAGLTEAFRRTHIASRPLFIPLILTSVSSRYGGDLDLLFGPLRIDREQGDFDVRTAFRDIFGFDVRLPESMPDDQIRALLATSLADKSLPAEHPSLKLADVVLEQIGRDGAKAPGDVDLVRAIIIDRRLGPPWEVSKAIYKLGPAAAPLAEPLLTEILASALPADHQRVKALAAAVRALPEGALAPVMPMLVAVARDAALRDPANGVLGRLADGGPENIPLLTDLLGVAHRMMADRDSPMRGKVNDIAVPTLIALCLLGEQAAAALPDVLAMWTEFGKPRDLLAITLDRLGAGEEVIERSFAGTDDERKALLWRLRGNRKSIPRYACTY